jgi:hypothetical protein
MEELGSETRFGISRNWWELIAGRPMLRFEKVPEDDEEDEEEQGEDLEEDENEAEGYSE